MSSGWMKIEKTLPDKPEVWAIADEIGIDPDAVTGKLIRVWAWFDDNTEDGNAPSVTEKIIDRYAGVTGFVTALKNCGWLVHENDTLTLPNYDRHNGKSAKKRALTAERQTKFRNGNVTQRALPEKRREEKNIYRGKNSRFVPPTPKEVQVYLDEKGITGFTGQNFVDHYEAGGWMRGKTKIKSWQHCVGTWIKNQPENKPNEKDWD